MFETILVQPLFNLLAAIYALIPGRDFGVAIIVLTILVRLALWPLVNKQLHSQKVMNQIAPQAKKIRDECKGDKQKEAQLLMELYKEKGVSPFSSMMPLFLQLPIFIALFIVLRDIAKPGEFERLSYEFVRNLDAIKAIISDQASFHPSLFGIDLAQTKNVLLAGAAGITQFFQSKQLAPKHADKQQQAMFKTTGIIFPALTVFIGYTLPAALSLYWAATSGVAMLQQHLVLNRDVEELEEQAEQPEKKKGGKGKGKK